MTMKDIITKKIEKNFPNAKFYIKDTSSKHVRHSQNNFKVESHFVINIISKKFSKLSKLDRQKFFFKILGENVLKNTHSISTSLKAPDD